MSQLIEYVKDQIWILEYPVRFAAMDLFARMTIIKLDKERLESLWTYLPIKSILDCAMTISEPVNECFRFHLMALAVLLAKPRRAETGFLKGERFTINTIDLYC